MKADFTHFLANEAATLAAGRRIAEIISSGMTIFLHGDLGAGKTTLTRGILQGFGYEGKVKSPTYTLVEPYTLSNKMLYHFDFYRFNDEEEWEAAGFRDYFNADSICLIEWPEKAKNLLPEPDLEIELQYHEIGRMMTLQSTTIKFEND